MLRFLQAAGEGCSYGLRSVELRQGDRRRLLGEYRTPGQVLLFDQPPPPWRLPCLAEGERERFDRAGAVVSGLGRRAVEVYWPGDTLQTFMLLDVLMHEIGHHLLQHHKGKRTVRVARTRDHEAYAERFAGACREAFAESRLA